jgi:hypothetical protein
MLSVIMPSVTNKPFMLSVSMLFVVMLSVVVPLERLASEKNIASFSNVQMTVDKIMFVTPV